MGNVHYARQRLLHLAGTRDIEHYEDVRRHGVDLKPLPRLLIQADPLIPRTAVQLNELRARGLFLARRHEAI